MSQSQIWQVFVVKTTKQKKTLICMPCAQVCVAYVFRTVPAELLSACLLQTVFSLVHVAMH